MSRDDRTRATAGLIVFIALSFLGSWCVAASLRVFDLTVSPATIGTRLFTTSLLYAATMGGSAGGSACGTKAATPSPPTVVRSYRPVARLGIPAPLGTLA